jgi:hypothetical protein
MGALQYFRITKTLAQLTINVNAALNIYLSITFITSYIGLLEVVWLCNFKIDEDTRCFPVFYNFQKLGQYTRKISTILTTYLSNKI